MPLVPQRVCPPSSLLPCLVPDVCGAYVFNQLWERWEMSQQTRSVEKHLESKREIKFSWVILIVWTVGCSQYLKDSLILFLVFWFGLPHPCTTTITIIPLQLGDSSVTDTQNSILLEQKFISPCAGMLLKVFCALVSVFCGMSEMALVVGGCQVWGEYVSSCLHCPALVCLSLLLLSSCSPEGEDRTVTDNLFLSF